MWSVSDRLSTAFPHWACLTVGIGEHLPTKLVTIFPTNYATILGTIYRGILN